MCGEVQGSKSVEITISMDMGFPNLPCYLRVPL